MSVYCGEMWTIGKQERQKIGGSYMWANRRMMMIWQVGKFWNEEVLKLVGGKKTLWKNII